MSHLSQDHLQHLYETFGELKVLDDIIRHRASDDPPVPILGYPRSQYSVDDYELFTGRQLDQFVDTAAKCYISSGSKPNGRKTVALLAPSNLDFIVSFFALSRLGYTVFCLSLRISPMAIIHLLQQTNSITVFKGQSTQIDSKLQKVNEDWPVQSLRLLSRSDYDKPPSDDPPFVREYDRQEENGSIALIIHSSGSTGLPKPVMLSHKALLMHPTQGSGLHNFNALPWYHLYGISTSLQAMWMRKTAYLYNTSLPLTADNLVAVLEAVRPGAVHVVPYALGLLAEKQRGVDALTGCNIVTAAGARTPDELGDRLVREGVNLGVVFGTTEAGLAGDTMRRKKGDDTWNYIRIYACLRKYIYMNPLGHDLYECVYLKGHPALSASNSDVPAPGSWHSKDVFTPHPSVPDIWKYVTRLDDRVTLVNGEKVLPLPIEGRMREDEFVREAVVVGVDQPIPGLLVFRASIADHLSDEAYIDAIWPSVTDANSRAEAFSQISREMIKLVPSNIEYPQTDKGNIIRAQVYARFENQIKELYANVEGNQGGLKLDVPALENFVMTSFRDVIGVPLESLETDFFTAGVDSLKAIQMKRKMEKSLDLNGKTLSANVVYEKGNTKELARYLFALREGAKILQEDEFSLMRQLIGKYSRFQRHQYLTNRTGGDPSKPNGQAVLLTGATGSIGAHTLAQLAADSMIEKVYCLVRGAEPLQRILDSLKERDLGLSEASKAKIIALSSELRHPDFGLESSFLVQMRKEVSLVIHIAWPVNFNIRLQSFEPHIAGLYNLLQLCLSVHRPMPARMLFCSSISTALNAPPSASIPETPITDFTYASQMGYARSKLVGEHIMCNAALAGAPSYVLRIGQVVGDTVKGVWNDKEFIPSMVRSALTLKALPTLRERCSWLPVDTLATVILDLSKQDTTSPIPLTSSSSDISGPPIFYNIVNPRAFSWENLLGELRAGRLEFTPVSFAHWLQMLRESAAQGDEMRNPAIKLLEYFEKTYSVTTDGGFGEGGGDVVSFETTTAQRDSAALRSAAETVDAGYVRMFLARWLRRWSGEDGVGKLMG